MKKEGKNISDAGVPYEAVKIREIGPWEVYFSKSESSVYFTISDSPSPALRLTRDELLLLAQETTIRRTSAKKTVASTAEARPSGSQREKRGFRRYTKRCEAEFAAGGVSNRGIASDFSINGLFLKTNHTFAADTVINISVHMPDGSMSSLQGKVRRAVKSSIGRVTGTPSKEYKNGIGVELTRRDVHYLNFIRSLIRK